MDKFTHARTISQLPEIETISDGSISYVGISIGQMETDASQENTIVKYSSRKISADRLALFCQSEFLNILHTQFNFPIEGYDPDKGSNFDVYDFLSSKIVYTGFCGDVSTNNKLSCNGIVNFVQTPTISNEISSFGISADQNATNVKTVKNMLGCISPFFINSTSKFVSKEMNVENAFEDEIFEAPTTESEKHNRYLFRMVGYRSINEWIAPESGIFTCWGWVDMQSDAYAGTNCNAWIALEGFISGAWRILQLQPFDKNNGLQLSYVGFTFPVSKGLKLRLTSGFRVGTNSNKFQSANGSLANHIANCFVGGIYRADMDVLATSSTRGVSNSQENEFTFHEDELKDGKSSIAELKAKLNAVIAQLNKLGGEKVENV